jgi:tRNA dimethylallyltransferase
MTIVLAGATAVGKSVLALSLARHLQGTILVADSMQVYKGMNIGTAKPTIEQQKEIPHGGIDCVKPDEAYSVADYLIAASAHIQKHSGRPLIICGGTGLYLKALREGIAAIPPIPESIQRPLQSLPLHTLQDELRKCDPLAAQKIDMQNPRRITRALAVMQATGKSIFTWQAEAQRVPLLPLDTQYYWIQRSEAEEKKRIEERVHAMMAAGWIAETQKLLTQFAPHILLSHPAIGYRQITQWLLEGDDSAPPVSLIDSILFATRQYRKRQYTWFRKESCWKILNASGLMDADLVHTILSDAPSSIS